MQILGVHRRDVTMHAQLKECPDWRRVFVSGEGLEGWAK